MEKTNFENLRVYQLAEQLADAIWNITCTWNAFVKDTLGKQIVRAADSIGANIAEGSGLGSDPDHRRFLRMARGSLYETQHWLRRAYKRRLLTQEQVNFLRPVIQELTPKLNACLRSIGKRSKRALVAPN